MTCQNTCILTSEINKSEYQNMSALRESNQQVRSSYALALETALRDLERSQAELSSAQNLVDAAEADIARLMNLITSLSAELDPDELLLFADRLPETAPKKDAVERGGEVFGNVVELFETSDKKSWSSHEVIDALHDDGKKSDSKAVYNVLNYLARKGRIRRLRRGHYLLIDFGVSVEIEDEIAKEYGNEEFMED